MSEKLMKLARQYGRALSDKQHKIFFIALLEFPFKARVKLAWKIFCKIPIVKFTKKEKVDIKSGRYLK